MLIQQQINAALAELRTLILLYLSGAGSSQWAGVLRCGGFNEMARRLRTGIFRAQQVGATLILNVNSTLTRTITLTLSLPLHKRLALLQTRSEKPDALCSW